MLRPYLLRRVLGLVCGREKDLETVHFKDLEELFDRQVGRRISLPYGMKACRCYEGVRVVSADWKAPRKKGDKEDKAAYPGAGGYRRPSPGGNSQNTLHEMV